VETKAEKCLSNPLRVKGKYASKLQKAEHEAKKWRSQSEMLLSMISGQYRTIRLMTEQINQLKCTIQNQ
jgi:hypothetical protein